jgi:uncharacterized protein (DUF2267 family)
MGSALTHDLFRSLILPKAEESRVAQLVVARPFGEGDLSDQSWFHPVDATARQAIPHGAYQALRAVLHCLRDRLTTDEAAQLGDQLPMLIRGIYYEAWRPAGKPQKVRSREEFLAWIGARLPATRLIDREDAARAVFQVLENHVSAGEIHDVVQSLPKEIRALWPNPQAVV